MSGIELLLDDHRGIYIPRDFANDCGDHPGWEHDKEAIEYLKKGPDQEYYWETWDDVLGSSTFTDKNGHKWMLYQDGALFAYCEELMTLEEKFNFEWDIEGELSDILQDNPEFTIDVNRLGPVEHWIWSGPEGATSATHFYSWKNAAYDCVTQNGLERKAD